MDNGIFVRWNVGDFSLCAPKELAQELNKVNGKLGFQNEGKAFEGNLFKP